MGILRTVSERSARDREQDHLLPPSYDEIYHPKSKRSSRLIALCNYRALLSYFTLRARDAPLESVIIALGILEDPPRRRPQHQYYQLHQECWVFKAFRRLNSAQKFSVLKSLEHKSANHVLCPTHLIFHAKDNLCPTTSSEVMKPFQEVAKRDPSKAWHMLRAIMHLHRYGSWLGISHQTSMRSMEVDCARWKLLIRPFVLRAPSTQYKSLKAGVYSVTDAIHECDRGSECNHSWFPIHGESSVCCPHVRLWDWGTPNDMGPGVGLVEVYPSMRANSVAKSFSLSRRQAQCRKCFSMYNWLVHLTDGKRWIMLRKFTFWGEGESPWDNTWMKATEWDSKTVLQPHMRLNLWYKGQDPETNMYECVSTLLEQNDKETVHILESIMWSFYEEILPDATIDILRQAASLNLSKNLGNFPGEK